MHGSELSKRGRPLPRGPERKQHSGMVSWIHGPQKCMVTRRVKGPKGPHDIQGPKVCKGDGVAPSTHITALHLSSTHPLSQGHCT